MPMVPVDSAAATLRAVVRLEHLILGYAVRFPKAIRKVESLQGVIGRPVFEWPSPIGQKRRLAKPAERLG